LTCFRARRRLGAYLDGALSEGDARWTERHLVGCAACRGRTAQLRRVKALVVEVGTVAPPDWTGFWPGIVRGIEDERHRAVPAPPRPGWTLWPRWAMGGAAVAALMVSLTLWQVTRATVPAEADVLVNSADTEHPSATVMVYAPADRAMAVVWVFDAD
jgi:anti-sigma factor RsiW